VGLNSVPDMLDSARQIHDARSVVILASRVALIKAKPNRPLLQPRAALWVLPGLHE